MAMKAIQDLMDLRPLLVLAVLAFGAGALEARQDLGKGLGARRVLNNIAMYCGFLAIPATLFAASIAIYGVETPIRTFAWSYGVLLFGPALAALLGGATIVLVQRRS